jgi:hypothetical protein
MPVTSQPLAFLRDPVVWLGLFAHNEALSIGRTVFDLFFKEGV